MDEFIRDLLQFTHACGSPHYRELAKLAPEVLARYKKRIPVLRPLSLTAISNVMTRQRQGPQPWGWVATYVLTCLHYVERTGITPDFPGPADLQEWHARYQAMRDQLDCLSAPVPDPTGIPPADVLAELHAGPAGAHATAPARPGENQDTAPAAIAVRTGRDQGGEEGRGHDGRWTGPEEEPGHRTQVSVDGDGHFLPDLPSLSHRRYYELFGQHGVDLLNSAERGDPDASCRVGILLLCRDRPAEAHVWLASAARSGDEAARVLINAEPGQRKPMAAELAYELTLPGYHQDRSPGRPEAPTGAETYYRAAAWAGHPGATVRLGLIYEARGDTASALFILAEAAKHHPDAHRHFVRLNRQYAQHQLQTD
ncbi:sel1 repeat family protein [Actinomadura sp. KC216]|uniref:sel1 repeat family protein n=1 Tax=Actinomadura sp. KC216 TaxID=2530370 RepID=UPI00104E6EE2|nr:sel1 repeat family protein [Actinomadura sp. KC216]TDB71782.1 sel1 repeat family protein [Actinomadura sp. KC216]